MGQHFLFCLKSWKHFSLQTISSLAASSDWWLSKHLSWMSSKSIRQHFSSISILPFCSFTIFFILFIQHTLLLEFLFLLQFNYALRQLFPTPCFYTLAFFANSILFFPSRTLIRNHFLSFILTFLNMVEKFNYHVHCCHLHEKHIASST